MQEVKDVVAIIASPAATAAFFAWIYSEIKQLRREVDEIRREIKSIDSKVDKLNRNVGYLEGRINGMRDLRRPEGCSP